MWRGIEEARSARAVELSALRLGNTEVNVPDEDFDRDPLDRRVIGWVGLAMLVVVGVVLLVLLLRVLR